MQRFRLLALLLALPLCATAIAQDDSKTSTPAEHQHWVDVLHQLEKAPLDAASQNEGANVFKRLVIVTDFHMVVCPVITEFPNKYKYATPNHATLHPGPCRLSGGNGQRG